jgi:hypothetical protein
LEAFRIRLLALLWALQALAVPSFLQPEVPAVLAEVVQLALAAAVQLVELVQQLHLAVDLVAQLALRFVFQFVSVRALLGIQLVGSESLRELPLNSKSQRNV